jgi:DNA gyrase subunit A
MSVIRADEVAHEDDDEDSADAKVQYVFTITDGGYAKRTRISEYRSQGRGGLGIKAMSLANEDRGGLVGAFIVTEGDEILSITSGGQVVRSPINDDFRPTGRSTMGVKFVTPKNGDSVAVVARSVERPEEDEAEEGTENSGAETAENGEASGADATIEDGATETAVDPEPTEED